MPDIQFLALGPSVAADGSTLYFESNHRQPANEGRTDTDVWIAQRTGSVWGNARPLGPPFDTEYQEHNVTVSARGTLCFNSRRPGGIGDHDIYCATRSGAAWNPPENAGAAVNSPSLDGAPHIDARERFMVFGSNRPGGAGGDDLYVSLRVDGRWLPAVNLGLAINTTDGEWAPAVSPDGRRLLVTRTVGERSAARSTLVEIPFDANRYRN